MPTLPINLMRLQVGENIVYAGFCHGLTWTLLHDADADADADAGADAATGDSNSEAEKAFFFPALAFPPLLPFSPSPFPRPCLFLSPLFSVLVWFLEGAVVSCVLSSKSSPHSPHLTRAEVRNGISRSKNKLSLPSLQSTFKMYSMYYHIYLKHI